MCDAGRIRHHLKHNLWRPECTILFVGYQSVGTLGRALVEGADEVKLFGETVSVRAEIRKMTGLSGHADKEGLIDWIQAFEEKPKKVFVVHGEDSVCTGFAECLKMEYGQRAYAPYSGTEFDLAGNKFTYEAAPVAVQKRRSLLPEYSNDCLPLRDAYWHWLRRARGHDQQGYGEVRGPDQFPVRQVGDIKCIHRHKQP